MNPDPNQPQEQPTQPDQFAPVPTPTTPEPAVSPEQPVAPVSPVETPIETATPIQPMSAVETPAPEAVAAPVETTAPNPFGGAPVASDVSAPNPFAAAANPDQVVDPAAPVVAAVAPLGSAPAGDPAATPPTKSKKKLIILISAIIGGLIILGGAALAIYLVFFTVTKADYQKASDQVSIVLDKYVTGSKASTNTSEDTVKATETAFNEFKAENAKLSDLKALRNDKELNVAYKAYDTKAKAFIALGDTLIPSLVKFVNASNEIKELGSGATSFTSANIQKTIDILKGVDITDPTLKTYLASTISAYEEILPQMKIYESASSTTAQKYAAISAVSDASDKVLKAATTMTDALKEKEDAVDAETLLDDLSKAVTAKLNDAK